MAPFTRVVIFSCGNKGSAVAAWLIVTLEGWANFVHFLTAHSQTDASLRRSLNCMPIHLAEKSGYWGLLRCAKLSDCQHSHIAHPMLVLPWSS